MANRFFPYPLANNVPVPATSVVNAVVLPRVPFAPQQPYTPPNVYVAPPAEGIPVPSMYAPASRYVSQGYAGPGLYRVVGQPAINVRGSASPQAGVLQQVSTGQVVRVVRDLGFGWVQVAVPFLDGRTIPGYVCMSCRDFRNIQSPLLVPASGGI